MNFFMKMEPPTATAQEHSVRVIKGKPIFFDPPKVKEAKQKLITHLQLNKPKEPLEGPMFPKGKSHRNGEWRVTKPDTDNLQKLLKDCMTKVGFWNDDAHVCHERVEKRWADEPSGIYIEIEQLKGDGNE